MKRPRSAFILARTATHLSLWTRYVPGFHLGTLHDLNYNSPSYPTQNGAFTPGHTSRNNSAYRVILPFVLIVAVFLLLVIRVVHSNTPSNPPEAILCPGSSEAYRVARGDTCWDLAQGRGCSVEDILEVNRDLRCDALRPGQAICLPQKA